MKFFYQVRLIDRWHFSVSALPGADRSCCFPRAGARTGMNNGQHRPRSAPPAVATNLPAFGYSTFGSERPFAIFFRPLPARRVVLSSHRGPWVAVCDKDAAHRNLVPCERSHPSIFPLCIASCARVRGSGDCGPARIVPGDHILQHWKAASVTAHLYT